MPKSLQAANRACVHAVPVNRTDTVVWAGLARKSVGVGPFRNNAVCRAAPGGSQVTVKSQIRQPGAEAFSIDYGMEKNAAGWMVYDVVVAGVNLATNYQESQGYTPAL